MPLLHHPIHIHPARVAWFLCGVIAGLVLLSTAGQLARFYLGEDQAFGFVPEFYLDAENNVPTYVSSVLLFVSAALLAAIASWKKATADRFRRHWATLGLVFLLLSMDEAASFHERLMGPTRHLLDAGGWLYFAWVVPGMCFVLLFVLAYLSFFFHLGRPFRLLFFVSGTLYVGGAIGFELIGGHHVTLYGQRNLAYALIATTEETLELSGIACFVYTLLRYLDTSVQELRLQIH